MFCPYCENGSTKVVDSRTRYEDASSVVIRRRQCTSCYERWNTIEIVDDGIRETKIKEVPESFKEVQKEELTINDYFVSKDGSVLTINHEGLNLKFDAAKLLGGLCQILQYAVVEG